MSFISSLAEDARALLTPDAWGFSFAQYGAVAKQVQHMIKVLNNFMAAPHSVSAFYLYGRLQRSPTHSTLCALFNGASQCQADHMYERVQEHRQQLVCIGVYRTIPSVAYVLQYPSVVRNRIFKVKTTAQMEREAERKVRLLAYALQLEYPSCPACSMERV